MATINSLINDQGMGSTPGQRLLFGGCSAGAIGAPALPTAARRAGPSPAPAPRLANLSPAPPPVHSPHPLQAP